MYLSHLVKCPGFLGSPHYVHGFSAVVSGVAFVLVRFLSLCLLPGY